MLAAIGAVKPKRQGLPLFARHASKALSSAKTAPGCVFAETNFRDGYAFSLTVWEARDDMESYATRPGHRPAMKWAQFTAQVFHFTYFEVDRVPRWSEAIARWQADLRDT